MCCVSVYFCSFDLSVKNSFIRFFCLSVQFSESIVPTRPNNPGSTVMVVLLLMLNLVMA